MEMRSVSFSYGDKLILDRLSLNLSGGKRICVMGESGRGKTTLLRLLLGLIKPQEGEIIRGENERPAVVFQEDRLLPWFTAKRNIEEVWSAESGAPSPAELIEAMELSGSEGKYPKELSGGMQRRAAIARALAFGGDPILLDEPFKGLDPDMRERIAAAVNRYSKGASILLITHDGRDAELLGCDETILLK